MYKFHYSETRAKKIGERNSREKKEKRGKKEKIEGKKKERERIIFRMCCTIFKKAKKQVILDSKGLCMYVC